MKRIALLGIGLGMAAAFLASPGMGWAQEGATPPRRISSGGLERPLRFDRLTLEDGLSQGEILDLLQDRNGFLWIATGNGLNRYDGYEVTVYNSVPFDTTSLADGYTTDVFEDRDGAIWVGTLSGHLARLDPATETFTHVQHDPDAPHSLSEGVVQAIAQDSVGTLWVGLTTGLNHLDPAQPHRVTHYTHGPDDATSLSHDNVRSVEVGDDGALWITTANGLARMDPAAPGRFERFLHDPEDGPGASLYRQYVAPGAPGVRWIGSDRGLVRFDAATGTAERFLPYPDRPTANVVRSVSPDPWLEGVFWLPVEDEGIARFDAQDGTFTHYGIGSDDPTGLVEHAGSLTFTDRSGIVWVGSQGSGLNRFDPATVGFAHYGAATANQPGLLNPLVWGLAVTRDGAVWAGTSEGFLHRITRETGELRVWEATFGDPPRPHRPVGEANAFAEDPDGTLWIGTTDGLDRYDPATDTFEHIAHDPDDPTSLSDDNVLALYLDRAGALWVGTGNGLNRLDRETGTFTRYAHDPDDPASLGHGWVTDVIETLAGDLWVATAESVSRLDPATGRFENHRHDPTDRSTLTSGIFGWLHERAREPGVLWVAGLSGGLDRFDTGTGVARHYTSGTSELPDNSVYAILEDGEGRLWMSTNLGLARFDPDEPDRSRAFRRFGIASGLQSLEFNQHAAATDAEGRLYFGGVEGINVFQPESVEGNPIPPLVALTDLRVSNESLDVGAGPLDQALTETERVELGHDERNVSFEYVGLHFKNPERNRYRYQLVGFDEGWVDAGTRRVATYTNLPAGDYTFRVTASNSDGAWSTDARTLALTVRPPWWGSGWALAVYALALGLGVVAVDRVQRRRLVAQERERTREREQAQARKVEQAYTELRKAKDRLVQQEKMASLGALTAGIAHEIKNPLNFVTNFAGLSRELADELATETDPDERRAILDDLKSNAEKIEAHGKRADAIVRQMMAHARSGSGQRRPVALDALVRESAQFAHESHRVRHPDADIALTLELSDVGEVEAVQDEIGRVLIVLVDNALDAVTAPGGSDGAPTVQVSTERRGGTVEVRVADNGVGMGPETAARVFEPFFTTKPTGQGTGLGLSLAHDIVVQGHGGSLSVETSGGEGSTFILELPAQDRPAGTDAGADGERSVSPSTQDAVARPSESEG